MTTDGPSRLELGESTAGMDGACLPHPRSFSDFLQRQSNRVPRRDFTSGYLKLLNQPDATLNVLPYRVACVDAAPNA